MHNYHTEDYHFHANGDPIPSDVLITKAGSDSDAFRSTSEEIVTFCAALRLAAIGPALRLRTTHFEIVGDDVLLRALVPQRGDARTMYVPIADLQEFSTHALRRRFALYLDDRLDGATASETMAGIGLFAELGKPAA